MVVAIRADLAQGPTTCKSQVLVTFPIVGIFNLMSLAIEIKLFNVGEARACAQFTVEQQMCNVANTLHGGYMASVIDALTVVQLLAVRDGKLAWTTNLNVHFLNVASLGEQVTVETTPIRITSRSILVKASASNDTTGLVVAKALNTFMFGQENIQKVAENWLKLDFSRND
ncbi:hypothetical protein MSG28_009193 [Choristoneura fumiferana]|uniref:Uncharacterized protein n=1 Tax=Choristoneura fumiferana TaxID=7141 RepID=A0ACC0KWP3_CHOFU|nr:hypothetical protein MSG28_009193 [Choristoneura fumiferana]